MLTQPLLDDDMVMHLMHAREARMVCEGIKPVMLRRRIIRMERRKAEGRPIPR